MGHSLLVAHGVVRRLLARGVRVVPVCPEVDGGLPVPRPASRVVGDRVVAADGRDVTEPFLRGSRLALYAARRHGCQRAYLVRGSPACDRDTGVAGRLLTAAGIRITRV